MDQNNWNKKLKEEKEVEVQLVIALFQKVKLEP